ncbi:hypothetical protein H8711_00570 [Clostridiaceae bacterium NSJ-31]|uniref:DUF2493 domain-containing protein n=1 Tax=Ligaoa zhengdingensis TaxID=2763658 RepID=A0A926DYA9_9FIRM|nr:DUF2493 domain-containing protein [Ligaoa zhengdingensis]MBC8545430.1 hypothetical protein [Ligaoa zhengdingensis]
MRVAVIGSRDICGLTPDFIIPYLPKNTTQLISGGAKGVDFLAQKVAEARSLPLLCLRPNYNRYGRRAPILRNYEICRHAELVLAFWNMNSPGTRSAILYCIRHGIPVRVIPVEK